MERAAWRLIWADRLFFRRRDIQPIDFIDVCLSLLDFPVRLDQRRIGFGPEKRNMDLQTANGILDAAGAHARAGDAAEAVRLYRQVLAAHPDQPDIWYNLGLQLRAFAV